MDRDEPQKPKPTAKAKQAAAGPSHLTRSKAKHTSQSDGDNSGSKSHQPPLKKKMRLGTEQADKSVENPFQNDLVLESLFKYMNRSDLLSCRIVNRQWQYEATKELRRRKSVIRFSFESQGNQVSRDKGYLDISKRLCQFRGTPSLLSSFLVKAAVPRDLRSVEVGSIFIAVGNQMKALTLHLNYLSKRSSFKKCSLTTDLQNLLFCQAPNLEFLEIQFDFPFQWKDELQKWDSPDHHQNGNNEFGLLPNLKTFIVSGKLPPKFFADVINAAVNLRSFGGDWLTCINYLMRVEGRAKIHQFKSLQLELDYIFRCHYGIIYLELIEAFLTEHKQNLKLETFECIVDTLRMNDSFVARSVGVINGILECSSGSLQKLRIEPDKWFQKLFIIPRLPQLKEICFDCGFSSGSRVIGGGFFPRGFNVNTSSPNVSSIVLLRCTDFLFRRIINRHRTGMVITEPVPSIRYIILNDKGKKGDIDPSLATVADFRHVFPNLVSISYVDSDD